MFSTLKYFYDLLATCAQLLSCVQFCDPMDCSLPGSSDCGIPQARVLEWAVISFSRGSSPPGDRTCVSCIFCIGRQILYHCTTSMSTNYPGSSMYWSFLGEWGSLQMEERGLSSRSTFHLPDTLRCSTGQGVLLEGAGAALSSTPGSAEALCEEGDSGLQRHIWGWWADTPERLCSCLSAFPMSTPSQAVPTSGRGGAPAGPREPGRDAQGPDAPGSQFLLLSVLPCVRPPWWEGSAPLFSSLCPAQICLLYV